MTKGGTEHDLAVPTARRVSVLRGPHLPGERRVRALDVVGEPSGARMVFERARARNPLARPAPSAPVRRLGRTLHAARQVKGIQCDVCVSASGWPVLRSVSGRYWSICSSV